MVRTAVPWRSWPASFVRRFRTASSTSPPTRSSRPCSSETDADRRLFLALLTSACRRHSIAIYSICLLDTHYHAVVAGRIEDLSKALHRAHSTYAREHNAAREPSLRGSGRSRRPTRRNGALFAQRFASWVIRDEEHYLNALEYVRMNPVRAGLVRRASDWPWSFQIPQAEHLFADDRRG